MTSLGTWWPLLLTPVAIGLGWWWWRRSRSRQAAKAFPVASSPRASQALASVASRRAARPPEVDPNEADAGPPTVLSWLEVGSPTSPTPPPSGPATPEAASPWREAGGSEVFEALAQGRLEQAWERAQDLAPPFGRTEPDWLDALDRLALAFEAAHRFDLARAVYERMADADPEWRHAKLRLMRARGLALNAQVNTWGTVPPQPLPQLALRALGRYLVEREIGRGAMGAVFQGYDPATGRRVALKTMALSREFSGADLAEARARFLREAEMSGRLEHPDIVSIMDAGESEGLAYIAMELVEGEDLSQHTRPGQLLPLAVLNGLFIRVAEALAYAHSRGVTHRDIKPANLMVNLATDTLKVMDFGVARVADGTRTRTGVVLGTPTFMSPEQLAGQTLDGRSDLYSLGVSMFQLLTGQLPHRNDSMALLMRAIAREPAPHVSDLRPDVPRELGDVVALALQKHPHTRYADGHQMAADLRLVAARLPHALDVDLT